MSSRMATVVQVSAIALLGVCIFLPDLGQERLIKSREARHAEIARVMVRTGEYAVPQVYGRPYIDKPPLYNWVVAGLFLATGSVGFTMARLPSVLCAIVGALAVYVLGRRWAATPLHDGGLPEGRRRRCRLTPGQSEVPCPTRASQRSAASQSRTGTAPQERTKSARAGVFSALVWMTTYMVIDWGRAARMDMMMAVITLCGILLADVAAASTSHRRFGWWCAASLLVGSATLSKGPVTLFFFFTAVVAIWRARLKRWRPSLSEIAVSLLIIAAPFVVWAAAAEHAHPGHLKALFGYQLGTGLVEHPKRIILYIDQAMLRAAPWAFFAVGGYYWAFRKLRSDGYSTALVPAAAFTVCLAVMTLVPNKRAHYLLPVWPMLVIFLGIFIDTALSRLQGVSTYDVAPLPSWAFDWTVKSVSFGMAVVSVCLFAVWLDLSEAHYIAGAAFLAAAAVASMFAVADAWRSRPARAVAMLFATMSILAVAAEPVIIAGLVRPEPETLVAQKAADAIPAGAAVADYRVDDEYLSFKLKSGAVYPENSDQLAAFIGGPGARYVLAYSTDTDAVKAMTDRSVRTVFTGTLRSGDIAVLEIQPGPTSTTAGVRPGAGVAAPVTKTAAAGEAK